MRSGTPRNISTDGSRYLFVGDHNQRVTGSGAGTFFWNAFPTRADTRFDFFRPEWIKGASLADGTLIAGGLSSIYVWDAFPTASNHNPRLTLVPAGRIYQNGDGPDVAVAGGRLYVNNYNGNNVLVYDRLPTDAAERPAFALGSPDPATNTLSVINYIQNPVVASDGTHLIATSDFDGALWIWSPLPADGAAPAVRIDLRASHLAPWDNALSGGRLVVGGNEGVGIWDALPLAGQAPARVFSRNIGSALLRAVTGIALDASNFYVATSDGTMYVWRGLPVTGVEEPFLTLRLPKADVTNLHRDGTYLCATARANPPAVYVYRVADFAAGAAPAPYRTVASSAQVPLNLPGGAITFGNSLAIANTSNNQVLLWERLDDAGSASSVTVLGQRSLQATEAAIGADRLFMPASLAYVNGTLWVGEFKFSSRILKFSVSRPPSQP